MEQITFMQIFWLMLATAICSGAMIILSALVTGYLVFRSKKEQHETLFPQRPAKRKGPIVIDDLAGEVAKDDEKGLPDVIMKMNEKINQDLAAMSLKRERE